MLDKLPTNGFKRKARKRIGRGIGSGLGKTSGKGHKGQRSRAGNGKRGFIGFEGGQTPLQRRLPKRGFTPLKKEPIQIVNIGAIALNLKLKDATTIDQKTLFECGLIRHKSQKIKLLGKTNTDLPSGKTFKCDYISHKLLEKLKANGNKIIIPKTNN